jgi:hypothetical protein
MMSGPYSTQAWGRLVIAILVVLVVFNIALDTGSINGLERVRTALTPKPKPLEAVSQELAAEAFAFVMERKQAYEEYEDGKGATWRFRGLGYLYIFHNLILAAIVPSQPLMAGRTHSIQIHNAHPNVTEPLHDCEKFTLWVRVRGPEIFAGSARAVPSTSAQSCYWLFDFDLQAPGEYYVDAKALLYNAKNRSITRRTQQQCGTRLPNITRPQDLIQVLPLHSGFKGFKMLNPTAACCEICSQLAPYCIYWASPSFLITDPYPGNNGCELFFKADTPQDMIPRSHILGDWNATKIWSTLRKNMNFVHGSPHRHLPAHKHIGCGWNNFGTIDFPCLSGDLDDKIFLSHNRSFVATRQHRAEDGAVTTTTTPGMPDRTELPLCTLEHERLENSHGRWVRKPWPNRTTCPHDMKKDENASKRFDVMEFDGNNPHCWHRDDLSEVGNRCIEMNCKFVHWTSKWSSPLREKKWFGVWRQNACDYVEYRDDQLQQCINLRNISSLRPQGRSIAEFLTSYTSQRLQNLKLFNASTGKGIQVKLDTLMMVHKVWMLDEEYRKELEALEDVPPNVEHFVVSTFYLSSERDIHIHVERIHDMNQIVREILAPKGYKFLNGFDLSAAFTYDTATQRDGLHIIGPPMKMIVTKLFHYLCKDIVEGSRV